VTSSFPPHAPIGGLAFPWNLFDTNVTDVDYGLACSDDPYVPTARGCVWGEVLALLGASGSRWGWAWDSADSRGTGVYRFIPAISELEAALSAAPGKTLCEGGYADTAAPPPRALIVWQDRVAWSTLAGTAVFELTGLPTGSAVVDTYAWDGWRSSTIVPSGSGGSVNVSGLRGNETYMFLAHEVDGCVQWKCTGFLAE
jgi:hypothetical protein